MKVVTYVVCAPRCKKAQGIICFPSIHVFAPIHRVPRKSDDGHNLPKGGGAFNHFSSITCSQKRVSELKRDANYLHMQRQTRVRMMMMAAATDAPTATAST